MILEAEFAAGLLPVVQEEIEACIGQNGRVIGSPRADALQFTYDGDTVQLLTLRTVIAVYRVLEFNIPRPKALLGHQNWQRLLDEVRSIINTDSYRTLYISAAGSDSSIMTRIKQTLGEDLDLEVAEPEGDLLLRIRPTPTARSGWDVLIRLTPRPLATRDWRVCNYEGALNASVAAAIVRLTSPTPSDVFLNIGCGSGTMLIERFNYGPVRQLTGVDLSWEALACTSDNLSASGTDRVQIVQADAIQLPLAAGYADKLVADLPFGQLVGSHEENEWLYPAIMTEAARVARQGAIFVVITHEVRLMKRVLLDNTDWQQIEDPMKITLSGLHPRIYVLERL